MLVFGGSPIDPPPTSHFAEPVELLFLPGACAGSCGCTGSCTCTCACAPVLTPLVPCHAPLLTPLVPCGAPLHTPLVPCCSALARMPHWQIAGVKGPASLRHRG